MVSPIMTLRTTPKILEDLDGLVKGGHFRSRTEAVNEAIRRLILQYRLVEVEKSRKRIAESAVGLPSFTKMVHEARQEEDDAL